MENKFEIRPIQVADCLAVLAIYKPYVLDTAITFEYEVPSPEEFAQRIETITAEYPWLVCLKNDKVVGYAYASKHRYRTAYQWSVESTIYLSPEAQGMGIARVLYEALFSILRLQGYFIVFGGVALPNEKSEGFHRAMGFEEIGDFKKIGFKMGKWHDVKWLQLQLHPQIDGPAPGQPITFTEIKNERAYKDILLSANERLHSD